MRGETNKTRLEMFMSALGKQVRGAQIEPELLRYPAIDRAAFRAAVIKFCDEYR
jgi:hypothetical protein